MSASTNGQLLTNLSFNPGKTISLLKARTSTPAKVSNHPTILVPVQNLWITKQVPTTMAPPMTQAVKAMIIVSVNFGSITDIV
jgi:hypothetical protein